MKKRMQSMILIVVLTMLFAGVSQAADEVSITKDLTAVIALLGLPCGKVVSVTRKAITTTSPRARMATATEYF